MIVYLDTNIVIYLLERVPTFGPKASARIAQSRAQGDTFVVSHLTRMECRIGPLRSGDAVLLAAYDGFFRSVDVAVADVSATVCDLGAVIRASYRFRAMDALHLSTSVENGCHRFLTNDTRLNRFTGLTVEVLP